MRLALRERLFFIYYCQPSATRFVVDRVERYGSDVCDLCVPAVAGWRHNIILNNNSNKPPRTSPEPARNC
eukprot:1181590-Prorocentrum_minimum.AAC.4